jgi:hypothetical protein
LKKGCLGGLNGSGGHCFNQINLETPVNLGKKNTLFVDKLKSLACEADTISHAGALWAAALNLQSFILSSHEKIPTIDLGSFVGHQLGGSCHFGLFELFGQKAFGR